MRPTRIPLFPLEVVLLPGMALPLHIFEPRYKLMIGRCLSERIEFGIVLAAKNGIATVGCTAEIVRNIRDHPDGRRDILTEGRSVFHLVQVLEEKEYYEAIIEYFPAEAEPQGPQKEARLIDDFQKCHGLLYAEQWVQSERKEGVSLAFGMAGRLPLELRQKQALLELPHEGQRRDYLLRWISEFLPRLAQRQGVQTRAGGNGHGPN
jgi:Lon protease-like protein